MTKIYLAGPDVFLSNAIEVGNRKKKLCSQAGFTGLFPLDNESLCTTPPAPQKQRTGHSARESLRPGPLCPVCVAGLSRRLVCVAGLSHRLVFIVGRSIVRHAGLSFSSQASSRREEHAESGKTKWRQSTQASSGSMTLFCVFLEKKEYKRAYRLCILFSLSSAHIRPTSCDVYCFSYVRYISAQGNYGLFTNSGSFVDKPALVLMHPIQSTLP